MFHLGQAVYRKVQRLGLQEAYNHPTDREIKNAVHMLLALAFVPAEDEVTTFEELKNAVPDEMLPLFEYFDETYVSGRRVVIPSKNGKAGKDGKGGKARNVLQFKRIPLRYPPHKWNQYLATLENQH